MEKRLVVDDIPQNRSIGVGPRIVTNMLLQSFDAILLRMQRLRGEKRYPIVGCSVRVAVVTAEGGSPVCALDVTNSCHCVSPQCVRGETVGVCLFVIGC